MLYYIILSYNMSFSLLIHCKFVFPFVKQTFAVPPNMVLQITETLYLYALPFVKQTFAVPPSIGSTQVRAELDACH